MPANNEPDPSMRMLDDVIVTCAVTGSIHVPSMTPHLPITPEEISDEAIAAAEAGASIVHIHVRDPETGEPSSDPDLFREVAERIHAACDVVVLPTTGGSPTMGVEERIQVLHELSPEMASFNMGSMNFALHPIAENLSEFEYQWEEEFLKGTKSTISQNSFEDLEYIAEIFDDHDTQPELECYDVGHLYNAKYLLDKGFIEPPIHLQFVTGILGGIGADPKNLTHLVRIAEKLFGDDFSFSVIGAGNMEFPLGSQAVAMDGHVRVGLEDNVYLRKGELAESNAQLVGKMVDLVGELTGRGIATPEDVRDFFGLKGRENVDF